MQRQILLLVVTLFAAVTTLAQGFGSSVEIITVYSQNERFYLKSIPYDMEFPTLRGTTSVFRVGSNQPVYTFERGFDSVDDESNNIFLSDDGETIFFVIPWEADEEKDGLKSISVYKHGELVKSYTASEVTGCDLKRERCDLVYNNYDAVVDREKSNFGSPAYKRVFKTGVSEAEKFLADYALFSNGNRLLLTDSKKNVHTFDLTDGRLLTTVTFDKMFDRLKPQVRRTRMLLQEFDAPVYIDFPKTKAGRRGDLALASFLGMKVLEIGDPEFENFRRYGVDVTVTIARDGTAEIEAIDVDSGMPREKVAEFFETTKFSIAEVPRAFPKWSVHEIIFLRKADGALSRRERQLQIVEQKEALKKQLVAETIDGVYIPKDLGDALAQLDKELSEINRKEMAAQPTRKDMVAYHMGLGTGLRNRWGLWRGSRLQKYFTDKGISHPEAMSSVILVYYWDWLKGDKESWKAWEKNPKSVF